MATAPAVYANHLYRTGHGWPLWFPDRPLDGTIHIGDVGYIGEDGAFVRLFNAQEDDEDKLDWKSLPRSQNNVPVDKHCILSPSVTMSGPEANTRGPSFQSEVTSPTSISSQESPPCSISFHCRTDRGAFLAIKDPTVQKTVLDPNTKLSTYVKDNIRSWHAYAESVGHHVSQDCISFVRGVVKTSDWALGAFVHSNRETKLALQANFGPVGSGFAFSSSEKIGSGWVQSRSGPYRMGTPTDEEGDISPPHSRSSSESSRRSLEVPLDQTVFLLRFRMKRKFLLPARIVAGAGEHQLPEGGDDAEDLSSSMLNESHCSSSLDPLDDLLSYILEAAPEAEAAMTGDSELYDLVAAENNGGWPEDLPAFFRRVRPRISVSEDKVATLLMEDVIYRLELRRAPKTHPKSDLELDPSPDATRSSSNSSCSPRIPPTQPEERYRPISMTPQIKSHYPSVLFGAQSYLFHHGFLPPHAMSPLPSISVC